MILKCPIMCFFFNVTFHALCSIDKSEQQIKILAAFPPSGRTVLVRNPFEPGTTRLQTVLCPEICAGRIRVVMSQL